MLSETDEKFNTIVKEAKKTALSKEEKERLRFDLTSFMKENPRLPETSAFASFSNVITTFKKPSLRYVCVVAAALLIGSGGIVLAAKNTLPGDLLYPVKTQLSEKAVTLLLFSDQAKAEYDIALTQLRLQETQTLTAQNRLNDQSTAEVKTLLADHMKDIQIRILHIKTEENVRVAEELRLQLEELLNEKAEVVDVLTKKDTTNDIKNILSGIKGITTE